MGYWSDWSVPILVTTAAAFTYIAGLLVWVEGLPWAHVGLLPGGAGLVSTGLWEVGTLSCLDPLDVVWKEEVSFGCSFGSPFPPPRPEDPFWLLASTSGIFQKLIRLPTPSVLHSERLRLSTMHRELLGDRAQICFRSLRPGNLPTSRSVKLGSFCAAKPRDLSQGNSQKRRLEAWSNMEGSQAWTGLGWTFLVPVGRVCCRPRVRPRAGAWSRVLGS